ncbi:hypothetical protein [Halosolutus gelatinilyticus]|uniref:hypothetical protein n=1 Tax=Halosolutus gelatinilyticus TaxID=2931975 RepID=UPI001FF1FDDD|nr:hypothetical protein [Halosolutus gelatinilyticus]
MLPRPSRAVLAGTFLRDARRLALSIRGRLFTRSKPLEPALLVSRSVDDIERALGERHFEPNWDMSFAYFGEVLNLRRVEYVGDRHSKFDWWQVHVRGYHHPDGVELTAHFETDPSEYPDAHVERVGIDIDRGLETLTSALEDANVEFRSMTPAEVAALD